jgi:hypothetical protein
VRPAQVPGGHVTAEQSPEVEEALARFLAE